MPDKTARELYDEWQSVRDELERVRADYGFVARTLEPGKSIDWPKKAVTPEAIEEIGALERKEQQLCEAYQRALATP